jgi:hypothetical protein
MKRDEFTKDMKDKPLPPPPQLIALGTVRELVRGNGSGAFDSADACATPGSDISEPPNCL